MKNDIIITLPSKERGFVEYKRSFCVEGKFNIDVDENSLLIVNILDDKNDIVRHIETNKKNKPIVLEYPGLLTYKDELDPGRKKMQDFGYPILCVDDIDCPSDSIKNACIKLWYNDNCFKGVIINTTDTSHGALFDDGLNFVDESGNPYECLPMGDYRVEVILTNNSNEIARAYKDFKIGLRDKQLICRFNPVSHKNAMINWCNSNNISIIEDLLPGYLEPYLNVWYYHMGILKSYRANDLCLFYDTYVVMFVYLIDKTSTSYETELGYLQSQNKINNDRFEAWHYDIGEAYISGFKGTPIRFNDEEYMSICRIDVANDNAKENVCYLDGRSIVNSQISDYVFDANESIQIMGVVKPWQMDCSDFVLKDDNTYYMNNYPDTIRYEFDVDGSIYTQDRKLLMERFDDNESIGNSVYEFYNLFNIKKEWAGKKIKVHVTCLDKKGNITCANTDFKIKIKEER